MAVPENTMAVVACGGRSTRMGRDKSMISYHLKPQRYHVYSLLTQFSDEVFLSVNTEQISSISAEYRFFFDQTPYIDCGPLAGLLSAFSLFPGKNILYVGCDYPFLDHNELEKFLEMVKPDKPASFYNMTNECYEPLIAWYPFCSAKDIIEQFRERSFSLHRFLSRCEADRHYPDDQLTIFNVNDPSDYKKSLELLHQM